MVVTSPTKRGLSRPDARGRRAREATLLPLLLASFAGLLFYALAFRVRGFHVPVADDTYFYVSAIRTTSHLGLATAHLLARPGYPLLAASLSTLTGASPWVVSEALPMAIAVATGLAALALGRRWGLRGWAGGLFALLAGISPVVARLVGGKSENLLTIWALAALAGVVVWRGGRAGWLAAAALAFLAGMAEWPFLLAFLAVIAVAAALPVARGERALISLGRLALAVVAGAAAAAVVILLINRAGPDDAIQQLPPAFRYGLRLRQELGLIWPAPTAMLVAMGWLVARRRRPQGTGVVWRVLMAWLLLTGLVLLVGLTGVHLPTYRALTFALPVILAMAAAPFLLMPARDGRSRPFEPKGRRGRIAVPLAAAAVIVAVAAPATAMWYDGLGTKTYPYQLGEILAAARYALSLPNGQRVVLVVDRYDTTKDYFYQRAAAAVLPARQQHRILIFSGRSGDALAGRPTLLGVPDLDAISLDLFRQVQPALGRGAAIVVARDLDAPDFRAALAGGKPLITPDVAVVRGPPPERTEPPRRFLAIRSWLLLLIVGMSMLVALAACGLGWSAVVMGEAPLAVRLSLAPAFGAVAIVAAAYVFERAGLTFSGRAGFVPVAVALAASGVAAAAARRGR